MNVHARAQHVLSEFWGESDRSITKAEYDRHYPPESRRDYWISGLWEFIRRGGALKFTTCESIARECGERMLDSMHHDYPDAFPPGYLKPSVRRRNQEHERDLIEARKRGREMAS